MTITSRGKFPLVAIVDMSDSSLVLATILLGALGVALFFLLLRRLTPKESVPQAPPKIAKKAEEKKEVSSPPHSMSGQQESLLT